jgi:tetratricopeptide (TPR) repeat protein
MTVNIKYSQKKQEMREDPVLEFLFKAKDYFAKNANALAGVAIAVVLVILVVVVYNYTKSKSQEKAEAAFGQAMIEYNNRAVDKAVEDFRIVADNYTSAPEGAMSAFMLGSIYFNVSRYDEAITWFEKAASKKTSVDFINGEAQEGIAGCYEAKGDIPRALEYYQKALDDGKIAYRHAAITWKLALLNRQMNNGERAKTLCQQIIADSTATDYRQRAENLLAALEAVSG